MVKSVNDSDGQLVPALETRPAASILRDGHAVHRALTTAKLTGSVMHGAAVIPNGNRVHLPLKAHLAQSKGGPALEWRH